MTRILERTDTGPYKLDKDLIKGDAAYLCRCGLSANGILCDGSHAKTRDEPNAQLVRYTRRNGVLEREVVEVRAAATAQR